MNLSSYTQWLAAYQRYWQTPETDVAASPAENSSDSSSDEGLVAEASAYVDSAKKQALKLYNNLSVDSLANSAKSYVAEGRDYIAKKYDQATQAASDVYDQVADAVSDTVDQVEAYADSAVQTATDYAASLWHGLETFVTPAETAPSKDAAKPQPQVVPAKKEASPEVPVVEPLVKISQDLQIAADKKSASPDSKQKTAQQPVVSTPKNSPTSTGVSSSATSEVVVVSEEQVATLEEVKVSSKDPTALTDAVVVANSSVPVLQDGQVALVASSLPVDSTEEATSPQTSVVSLPVSVPPSSSSLVDSVVTFLGLGDAHDVQSVFDPLVALLQVNNPVVPGLRTALDGVLAARLRMQNPSLNGIGQGPVPFDVISRRLGYANTAKKASETSSETSSKAGEQSSPVDVSEQQKNEGPANLLVSTNAGTTSSTASVIPFSGEQTAGAMAAAHGHSLAAHKEETTAHKEEERKTSKVDSDAFVDGSQKGSGSGSGQNPDRRQNEIYGEGGDENGDDREVAFNDVSIPNTYQSPSHASHDTVVI